MRKRFFCMDHLNGLSAARLSLQGSAIALGSVFSRVVACLTMLLASTGALATTCAEAEASLTAIGKQAHADEHVNVLYCLANHQPHVCGSDVTFKIEGREDDERNWLGKDVLVTKDNIRNFPAKDASLYIQCASLLKEGKIEAAIELGTRLVDSNCYHANTLLGAAYDHAAGPDDRLALGYRRGIWWVTARSEPERAGDVHLQSALPWAGV